MRAVLKGSTLVMKTVSTNAHASLRSAPTPVTWRERASGCSTLQDLLTLRADRGRYNYKLNGGLGREDVSAHYPRGLDPCHEAVSTNTHASLRSDAVSATWGERAKRALNVQVGALRDLPAQLDHPAAVPATWGERAKRMLNAQVGALRYLSF